MSKHYGFVFSKNNFVENKQFMSIDAVIECVNEAIHRRGISNPVVIHSDRGMEYKSSLIEELIDTFEIS